jgi:hypothetical protein
MSLHFMALRIDATERLDGGDGGSKSGYGSRLRDSYIAITQLNILQSDDQEMAHDSIPSQMLDCIRANCHDPPRGYPPSSPHAPNQLPCPDLSRPGCAP